MNTSRIHLRPAIYTLVATAAGLLGGSAHGAPTHAIVIDGLFADWNGVPSYLDPLNDETLDWHGVPPAPWRKIPTIPTSMCWSTNSRTMSTTCTRTFARAE